ncbi:hypothetical protein Tco_0485567 [Tanacetum coccineum]
MIFDIGLFIKWFCRRTGKKKLCKADLEGPAFNLVKAFHKNSVFLQYQMDECHKLLTNKVDLSNLEGHQILRNIYEPLPLGGPPGQEKMEFYINKHSEPSDREAVRSQMRILSVISVKKRFRFLHPNDFEDLFLLNIQEKLNHLPSKTRTKSSLAKTIRSSLSQEQLSTETENDQRKLMRLNELHKFSDGTLTRVMEKLDQMVKDFHLYEYNKGIETRKWSEDDKRRSKDFITAIEKRLQSEGLSKSRKLCWRRIRRFGLTGDQQNNVTTSSLQSKGNGYSRKRAKRKPKASNSKHGVEEGKCMRTRSKARRLRQQQQQVPPNLVEPPKDTMADNRTMAE